MNGKQDRVIMAFSALVAIGCLVGMIEAVQNFGIGLVEPYLVGSSFSQYFTPESMKQYFTRCISVLLFLDIAGFGSYALYKGLKSKIPFLSGDQSPFILLAVGTLMFRLVLILNWGDDVFFRDSIAPKDVTLLSFLTERYFRWSSRLIIETFTIGITHIPFLWIILDTAFMSLIAYCISALLPRSDKKINYFIVCLIFIYPFIDMRTAGWVTTTMNYTWPLAFGLYALLLVKRVFNKQTHSPLQYALAIFGLLYATNHEQMGAILLGLFVVLTAYYIVTEKTVHWYLALQSILALASFVFIMTAPGNAVRTHWTLETQFPQYATLGFMDKLELGFSSTWFNFIMQPDFSFVMLALLLFLGVRQNNTGKGLRIVSILPLGISLLFGLLGPFVGKILAPLGAIRSALTLTGTNPSFTSPLSMLPDALFLVVLVAMVIAIMKIFGWSKETLLLLLVLGAGFASRMVMAFTPAIWFSGDRTFIFLYFAMIFVSAYVFQTLQQSKDFLLRISTVVSGFSFVAFSLISSVTHLVPLTA